MIRRIRHKLVSILLVAIGYLVMWLIPVVTSVLSLSSIIVGVFSVFLSPLVGLRQGLLIGLMQLGLGATMLGVGFLMAPVAWYSVRYLIRFVAGLTHLVGRILKRRLKEIV